MTSGTQFQSLMQHSTEQSVWTSRGHSSAALEVYLLGTVDFDSTLVLQDRLVHEISQRDDRLGAVILCEHPPVVTVGLDGRVTDLPLDTTDFTSRMMNVRRVDRRGGTLIHTPGQIAAYVVLPLHRLHCDEAASRHKLAESVVATANEQRVNSYAIDESTGVISRCGQFSWITSSVNDGVSSHGLILNVSPELYTMRLVRSTSEGRQIASLSMQLMQPVPMHRVRESLMRHLAIQFGYQETHPYTGHPLLKRTYQKVAQYV